MTGSRTSQISSWGSRTLEEARNTWQWDGDVLRRTRHPDYWFGADRFQTEEDLAHWLDHLGEKLWVSKFDLMVITERFRERVCPQ